MSEGEDERRAARRERAPIAAEVRVEGRRPALGVMKDASELGMQLVTHTILEVGDHVEVALQLTPEEQLTVAGAVARLEKLEPGGPWRYRVGISLDESSPELVRAVAEIQALDTGD